MSTFAMRVKEQRTKKGFSQAQMAEEIGLTKQTVSLWERGVRRPDFETMVYLADYFNVSVAYLIGQSDDATVSNEDEALWVDGETVMEIEALCTKLAQMSPKSRSILSASIHEAYRLDRISGDLDDSYTAKIIVKKPHFV